MNSHSAQSNDLHNFCLMIPSKVSIEPLKGICKSGCGHSMLHGHGKRHTCLVFCTQRAPNCSRGPATNEYTWVHSSWFSGGLISAWQMAVFVLMAVSEQPSRCRLDIHSRTTQMSNAPKTPSNATVRQQTTSILKCFSTPALSTRRKERTGDEEQQKWKRWITHTRGDHPRIPQIPPLLPATDSMQVWPYTLLIVHCELTETDRLHLQGEGTPHLLHKHFG